MFKRFVLMIFCVAVLVVAGTLQAATDQALANMDGDVIARVHFAGTARVSTSNSKLRDLAALPETALVREELVEKLATTPFRIFKSKLAAGNTNDYAALLHPMVEDLVSEESYLEVCGPASAMPETMLAVQLNNNRAQLWRDGLSRVLSAWTGMPAKEIKGDGYTGWELRKHDAPNVIRFLRAGNWVLIGWGQDELRLQPGFLHRIKMQRSPAAPFKNDWLDAIIDWPTFMKYHPFMPPGILPNPLPKMHLTIESRKDDVRPKLVVQFPQSLNLNLEPWKIPTQFIRNPISSFTAVRGIQGWLAQQEVVKQLRLTQIPNEMIFWAVPKLGFCTDVAVPLVNASNYLAQTGPWLTSGLASYLAQQGLPNHVLWTNSNLFLAGVPVVTPHITWLREASGDYLVGGLMPSIHRTNSPPFPRELLREIGSKPNLVCYSWEINEERVQQWIGMHEYYMMLRRKPTARPSSTGMNWIKAAKSKLGNCGTEITLTAPNELTLLRNGPIGLTGMDMVMLELWLDAPGFPLDATYPQTTFKGIKRRAGAPVLHRTK